jgi:uncharacterized membrane protein
MNDWLVTVFVIIMAVVFIVVMIVMPALERKRAFHEEEIRVEEYKQFSKQREELLANHLNVSLINLIISTGTDKNGYYTAKTNGKSYTVKFNEDYTQFEKFVEDPPIFNKE